MSYYTFDIEPRDLLFFRDARPMESGDAGQGGHWPRPEQLHAAFIHALHRRWPKLQAWEHEHRKNPGDNPNSSDRFGGLRTAGPWPVAKDGRLFLPCPLDMQPEELNASTDKREKNLGLHPLRLMPATGNNLPQPLTHAVYPVLPPSKAKLPQWLSADVFAKYLRGEQCGLKKDQPKLYDVERNIGIAIDPETHTTIEGNFFQAEYLRLQDGIKLACRVSCLNRAKGEEVDVIAEIIEEEGLPLILGGQQGVATTEIGKRSLGLPPSNLQGDGLVLRWTLLTPAVFPVLEPNSAKNVKLHSGGWLPSWVEPDTGAVMLKSKAPAREEGESRKAWRKRVAALPPVDAKLIAARIGKPLTFSGWDERVQGPRPTQLAVPAGSAYFFSCRDRQALEDLAAQLSWNGGTGEDVINRRSTVFGEKGYGLGVCSILQEHQSMERDK